MRGLHKSLILLTLTLILTSTVVGAGIKGVRVRPENIKFEKAFDIEVDLKGEPCSMIVKFFLDDSNYSFANKNVGCKTEEVEFEWEKNDWDVRDLKCGTHTIRVELVSVYGTVEDTKTIEFDAGNPPKITFDPQQPQVNKNVKITFRDKETGEAADRVEINILNMREGRWEFGKNRGDGKRTNSAGQIEFKPDTAGEYKIESMGNEYCGIKYFHAKKKISYSGPTPSNPVVGDAISMTVPSGVGVKVYDNTGKRYTIASTSLGGGVNFTINNPGEYRIAIGELSSQYWGVNHTLNVSEKPVPEIKITPENPVVEKTVEITIISGGRPLGNAKVTIHQPNGLIKELLTLPNGRVAYDIPVIGQYRTTVEKSGYDTSEKAFEAKNKFSITFAPEKPITDEDITVIVKDQNNRVVSNALISIEGAGIQGLTDSGGGFTFKLTEPNKKQDPREYPLKITKSAYWDLVRKIKPFGVLSAHLSSGEVEAREPITITVYNSRGALVRENTLSIIITRPDKAIQAATKPEYVFRPDLVGEYTINVSKLGYIRDSASFTVNPIPIEVHPQIIGNLVVVNVTSRGKPVEGLTVQLIKPEGGTDEKVTSREGLITSTIEGEGDVTIKVNEENIEQAYVSKSVTRNIVRDYNMWLLFVPLFIIVFLAFAVIAFLELMKKGGGKERESLLEKSARTSLSSV